MPQACWLCGNLKTRGYGPLEVRDEQKLLTYGGVCF